MNPLRIADQLRTDYLQLLTTTFAPRQEGLKRDFGVAVEREGFLTREPFVSLALPYQQSSALTELLPETRERFGPIAETPYAHQGEAVRRIIAGLPTVVATGTGSGKTEAFLMPIIDLCLRAAQPDTLKAILVYPMNALANDQRNRIRKLLTGTSVSFGVYTGETGQWGQRPEGIPDNERFTRAEFRAHPPEILLTNYRMLEYLLLRGDGRALFHKHSLRYVVLDEVHTYKGALGTDVACLVRRLRAALGEANPLFIGTSATLQSGEGDPRTGVAEFFEKLTGQPTPKESVIREHTEAPALPSGLSLAATPNITQENLDSFSPAATPTVSALARKLTGRTGGSLEECWGSTVLPYLLLNWLKDPLPISGVVQRLSERPERAGVSLEALAREVQMALLIGPCLEEKHPLRLRPRVHRFLRGLARFWRCTNKECGKLLDSGVEVCDACGCSSLPLALCRTCGWDFFVGRHPDKSGAGVAPWLGRRSTPKTVFVYDPPGTVVQVDPEDSPDEGEEPDDTESNGDTVEEPVAATPVDATHWLCPQCLSLTVDRATRFCGCEAVLRPVRLLNGRGTNCPVCRSRYGRFDVITPVSLGNSSALTHVSRTLLRELPVERRKLLIFTDSRQDAAHQARFPVHNLWLLMLYASDLFRDLEKAKVAIEANPDDIPDLVAEILCRRVERRIQRNLSHGFQSRKAVLGRVRGRIDLLNTESHRLLDRGKIACRFDELTVDTARNRFVRVALEEISKIVCRDVLAHRCRSLAVSLRRMGVVGERPERGEVSINSFGRSDIVDRPMVVAAHLAFNLALPTEAAGAKHLSQPDREITWIRKLYEKGVAGFYEVVLSGKGWRVDAGKTIGWLTEGKSPGIDRILPSMRTDIILDHSGAGRRIVIDTKFNSVVTHGWYREETLRSGYVYQIYSYLRSQEGNGDPLVEKASGLLLHPSVGDMVNETVVIQKHEIRFATVDLAATAKEIRAQLLRVLGVSHGS